MCTFEAGKERSLSIRDARPHTTLDSDPPASSRRAPVCRAAPRRATARRERHDFHGNFDESEARRARPLAYTDPLSLAGTWHTARMRVWGLSSSH